MLANCICFFGLNSCLLEKKYVYIILCWNIKMYITAGYMITLWVIFYIFYCITYYILNRFKYSNALKTLYIMEY